MVASKGFPNTVSELARLVGVAFGEEVKIGGDDVRALT